jgi:iron complex outermembrane receptor protein
MKRVMLILLASACLFIHAHGQVTLSGVVENSNGESLVGANVVLDESFRGTSTGLNGEFKFSGLEQGNYRLFISYVGYQDDTLAISLLSSKEVNIVMEPARILGEEVIVRATRAGTKTPVSYSEIDEIEIERRNFGQDIPVIINQMPSVVATTDAGNGIGYTGLRIRGTDLNRINVTINGIPLNDAESHGVFWVDLPDFAGSTSNIQIQRGVGTSTNGAGAFGATINVQTNELNKNPYAEYNGAYGSFNTIKNTVNFGTGLINDKFTLDGRLSKITSDGFIDRARADLKSFYLSGGYFSDKNILKFNITSGLEETYQAWWGVPKVRLENDMEGMLRYQQHGLYTPEQTQHMIDSDSRTYNYYTYDNEIDHYLQSHYQLHYSREINRNLFFNTALHYTRGKGYFEQERKDDAFAAYGLDNVTIGNETITQTDVIRRRWLDNHFYGITYSLNYNHAGMDVTIGGAWNEYDGKHYGNIIWSEFASNSSIGHEWYNGSGLKQDFNVYTKVNYQFVPNLNVFADVQYRGIRYDIEGIDNDLRNITMRGLDFNFINPKVGTFYTFDDKNEFYFSFATANREPNRTNYVDAPSNQPLPDAETLYDYELGYHFRGSNLRLNVNLYYMDYDDQLVLTGEINDVGAAIMTNVENSYRRGIEVVTGWKPLDFIQWDVNVTLSQNKIEDFNTYVDNWDYWSDPDNEPFQLQENLGTTDLSFSPSVIGGSFLNVDIIEGLNAGLTSKYVSRQYIDNTSSKERSLDPYFINDFTLKYNFALPFTDQVQLRFLVNNIFDVEYETNAWVYRYHLANEYYTMDGYFPQAGRNYLAGLIIKF